MSNVDGFNNSFRIGTQKGESVQCGINVLTDFVPTLNKLHVQVTTFFALSVSTICPYLVG